MERRPKFYLPGFIIWILLITALPACKKGVQQQEDELYSRHLQRKVALTIVSTPLPDDKTAIHLLICNDGQLFKQMNIAEITDSLYKQKKILPLVIVGVHAGNRMQEYGIADQAGKAAAGEKADHYDSFFNNELYPYIKKNTGVRKFNSVAIAGFGAGGLSALDIAWNHADKIGTVGIFSGAFSRKLKAAGAADTTANGTMYEKLKTSRKRPHLRYWFYAGDAGTTGIPQDDAKDIRNQTQELITLLKSKSFIAEQDIDFVSGAANNKASWQPVFPEFLIYAFGQ